MTAAMQTAHTADEAYDHYLHAYETDALIQGAWHRRGDGGNDGRDLACGLGTLGPDINSPNDCPAAIMPRWLAQQVVYFFDGQDFADAKDWGLRFYAELKRLGGKVPFSVVHDWQATVVAPLAIETAEKRKLDPALPLAVQKLHERALNGDLAAKAEWLATLKPAYRQLYAYAYANADAYAYADADAYANANANAYAYANADAYAYANADAYADAKRLAVKRLADGMLDCMARVPSEAA